MIDVLHKILLHSAHIPKVSLFSSVPANNQQASSFPQSSGLTSQRKKKTTMRRLEVETLAVVKTQNPNLPPQPIFHPLKPKTFPREASFSAYLKPDHDNTSHQKPTSQIQIQAPLEDSEISIFDAQKYFSEASDQDHANDHIENRAASPSPVHPAFRRISSVSSSEGCVKNQRSSARSFRTTPTASSEASWNSQTGLLSHPAGSVPVHLRAVHFLPDERKKRFNVSSPRWFFRLKCPCTGKKSVQVEEKLPNPQNSIDPSPSNQKRGQSSRAEQGVCENVSAKNLQRSSPNTENLEKKRASHRDSQSESEMGRRVVASLRPPFADTPAFSFPILGPPPPMKLVSSKGSLNTLGEEEEDPSRRSLEVFRPRDRRSFGYPPVIPEHLSDDNYDAASDTSSDLFEIESFPTQSAVSSTRDEACGVRKFAAAAAALSRRHSLDGPATPSSAAAITECYEPSEASIEWSVTTAEGFGCDRGSVASFCISAADGRKSTESRREREEKNGSKRRGGMMMMSCKWDKAVSVGPSPVRFASDSALACGGDGGRAAAVAGVGYRKPPLGKSQSARLSLPLAT